MDVYMDVYLVSLYFLEIKGYGTERWMHVYIYIYIYM